MKKVNVKEKKEMKKENVKEKKEMKKENKVSKLFFQLFRLIINFIA